jgi:FAD/FMN-containing dehydrogenase
MSQRVDWAEKLSETDYGLMQTNPYPVASPSTVDALSDIVRLCVESNWRVLPLGSGSSFPENFALKSDRTFAIATTKLREVSRLSNGRVYCQPGVLANKIILSDDMLQRKTLGGLICGSGDLKTRNAAKSFWQAVQCVELIDAKGRTVVVAGPASAQYPLSARAAMLLESRGKAGFVVGIEFCADELPVDLDSKQLSATVVGTENVSSPVSRQLSYRGADALSLFDW